MYPAADSMSHHRSFSHQLTQGSAPNRDPEVEPT